MKVHNSQMWHMDWILKKWTEQYGLKTIVVVLKFGKFLFFLKILVLYRKNTLLGVK